MSLAPDKLARVVLCTLLPTPTRDVHKKPHSRPPDRSGPPAGATTTRAGQSEGRAPDVMLEQPGQREDAGSEGGVRSFPALGNTLRRTGSSLHRSKGQ